MTDFPTALTELEAVNVCLSSIGEPPINSLDNAGIDAQIASDLVREVSRTCQQKGWHWNREIHTLSPDVDGYLNLPNNTARIDSINGDKALDVVQRGLRLFNRAASTYTFTSPVELELVVYLTFDELPDAAKEYVTARAAMLFQQRMLSSDTLNADLKARAQEAWNDIVRAEVKTADPNPLRDNWSTLAIVQRGWFRRGAFQSGVY